LKRIIIISNPEQVVSEHEKLLLLFQSGLQQYHIRKPDFSDFDMINYIEQIPKKYHRFLVLHSHYHLAKKYNLKGIQVGVNRIKEAEFYRHTFEYFGYSAHSLDEIERLQSEYTHFFISPVFNSISKKEYLSNISLNQLFDFIKKHPEININALGGISIGNLGKIKNFGFRQFAFLGSIWQLEHPEQVFKELYHIVNSRPFALTIAGFDPSSGAGLTADIKTFEQHEVQALAVTTCITYQNEKEFDGLDYLSFSQIKRQIDVLFKMYHLDFVKIGLVQNLEILVQLVAYLKSKNRHIKIIWDPILKSSSGFTLHSAFSVSQLNNLLKDIYLVTPNLLESQHLFGTQDEKALQSYVRKYHLQHVLLKGGHSDNNLAVDKLISSKTINYFSSPKIKNSDKHGTGCILSSAITANLCKGYSLLNAVKSGKLYTSTVIKSNDSLLAYHNLNQL